MAHSPVRRKHNFRYFPATRRALELERLALLGHATHNAVGEAVAADRLASSSSSIPDGDAQ